MGFSTRANITGETTDNNDIRVQQVEFNGRASDVEIYFPYGMSANVPENSLCLLITVNNDDGYLLCLPDRSQDRPKGLKKGEVAFFNPLTQSRTLYQQNGDIVQILDGDSGNKVTVVKNDYSVHVNNNYSLNSNNEIDIASSANFTITSDTMLNVNAPEAEFSGNVKILGNLEVVGNTTLSDTVTSNGKDISDTHTHTGSATAPDGPIAPTGVVE